MKGSILEFDENAHHGIISGQDGNRYEFNFHGWVTDESPKAGMAVEFSVADGVAIAIYAAQQSSPLSSKKIFAALLAFFLGTFGIHKFYLGYKKQGIIMLLVSLCGFILLGIPTIVVGLIALIECIIYLTKSDEEFEEVYVIGKKPWF